MKAILGISAFYHDAAATLLINGEPVAAAQEERFTRKKHTPDFPVNAIRYCLDHAGITIDELDAVVFYDKPLLKFERLLETYYAFSPKGLISFCKAIPVWIREKMFLKKMIREGLKEAGQYEKKKLKLLFSEHHFSHAASAFYSSPFEEAAILSIDGVGEWATATICHGKGTEITLLKEMRFPHSVGLLYSSFTYYLGFRVNSGEYKLMGLAPYGDPHSSRTQQFIALIKEHLVSIKEDGSIWLNQDYFNYATGLKMIKEKKWEQLFGFPAVPPDGQPEQVQCDLAYAIQQVTEEIVLNMVKEAKRITGADYLCLSGGVALNCVANGKIIREKIFKDVFIQPASGDAGGSLGAAQMVHYNYFEEPRTVPKEKIPLHGFYLGPDYDNKEIIRSLKKHKAVYHQQENFETLCQEVAAWLAGGQVIGWFRGRMEFGPRALGNRSILADARNKEMQQKLNLKIKHRESFRPFAPSVLAEEATNYFDLPCTSPYMLLVADIIEQRRKPLPSGYHQMSMREKLHQERSDIPAVTHLDFSARVQTVHRETNPAFWQLLQAFKEKTGYAVLINTSFNVRGEPMVCTPDDAYRCFMATDMDYLVINDMVLKKTEQPGYADREKWEREFKPD
ncbi:MAG: carbamoyltransferase [Chitinophagaceae bacterium]|nr:carbamoyltransferase [Chitinophagaceae bacterium]